MVGSVLRAVAAIKDPRREHHGCPCGRPASGAHFVRFGQDKGWAVATCAEHVHRVAANLGGEALAVVGDPPALVTLAGRPR